MSRCPKRSMLRRGTGRSLIVPSLVVATMLLASGGAGATTELPEPVLGSLRTALVPYEEVRGDLALDQLAAASAGASRLAGALRLAIAERSGLAGELSVAIEKAASAADSLAAAEDLAAARSAFGEISRGLVRLAGYDARLAEGWHLFACPMAESYGRWLQPSEAIDNPYMGTSMPTCGSSLDWSMAAPAVPDRVADAAAAPDSEQEARVEPVFTPGIPNLKMVDVRDHKFLWREIEELQVWERGDRISISEFRSKAIEKTAHFLGFEGAAAEVFTETAVEAVGSLRDSARQGRLAADATGKRPAFSDDLNAAVDRMTSLLGDAARHELFAPDFKKWLLRLAFSPTEREEARETALARSDR